MTLVVTDVGERIATVRLARLEKKNALNGEMYEQLAGALVAADQDPAVRAILLCGTENCFTAGNEIGEFLKPRMLDQHSPAWKLFQALPGVSKPIVAAVGGPAIGIGTTLLLHCDLVYAASNARFQLPFVPLGIVPEFASTYLLPLLAGYQRAAELLLLGQPFDAQKACEVGIATAVVAPENLMPEARKAAAALAGLPRESVRLTKQLMKKRHGALIEQTIAEEAGLFRERLASPEAKEAISAFLEKRKPDFSRF